MRQIIADIIGITDILSQKYRYSVDFIYASGQCLGLVTRMRPNIGNAHRIQSECLECTSNINECGRNFHCHSGSFRHSWD